MTASFRYNFFYKRLFTIFTIEQGDNSQRVILNLFQDFLSCLLIEHKPITISFVICQEMLK